MAVIELGAHRPSRLSPNGLKSVRSTHLRRVLQALKESSCRATNSEQGSWLFVTVRAVMTATGPHLRDVRRQPVAQNRVMNKATESLHQADQRTPIDRTRAHQPGQHARLQRELAMAFSEVPWNQLRVQRIANEIEAIEGVMALGS